MTTKAQRDAIAKYDKENTVRYTLKLNKNTDSDLIMVIALQDNKQGFIKACLRKALFPHKRYGG